MPKITVSPEGTDSPVEIYYEVHGTGPEHILCINGMGSIAHMWDLQVEYFTKFPEYSICIFDNRGSGLSSSPASWGYSTREMAKDAFRLLEHLGWKQVHIVGVSMGGMIGQELAYMLGDDVKSMTLVSTYCRFNGVTLAVLKNLLFGSPQAATIENYVDTLCSVIFPQEWLDSAPKANQSFSTNRELMRQFIQERIQAVGLQNPVGRRGQQAAAVTHYFDNRTDALRKHGYPILVLTGDKDEVLLQPHSSQYLAEQLGAKLEIYQNGGHALRLQDPEWHNVRLHDIIKVGTARYQECHSSTA